VNVLAWAELSETSAVVASRDGDDVALQVGHLDSVHDLNLGVQLNQEREYRYVLARYPVVPGVRKATLLATFVPPSVPSDTSFIRMTRCDWGACETAIGNEIRST
jgi:hypothetical protein